MAKLSEIIVAPRVQCTLSSEDESHASFRDLEVDDVQFVDTLDSVRRIELPENAFAPHEQLLVS